MKSGALVLGTFVSALLLAAAGVLYVMAGNHDGSRYRDSIDLVRRIQQLSSGWSIEVARVRTDPLADFDSLAAFIPRMARLHERLAHVSRNTPGLPDRLAADIQAFLSAVEAQEERIERFKTGYAVVRNSTRYLPLAAENVVRRAREADDEPLARRITTLTQDLKVYLATPSDTAGRHLGVELEALREDSVGYPPPLANALANLLAHAEVLLERQAPTDELFHAATSSGTSDLANRIAGGLEFEIAGQDALATRYELGVLAAIGALALCWILLAVHQRARGGAPAPDAGDALANAARIDAAPEASIGDLTPLRATALPDEVGPLPVFTSARGEPAAAPPSPAGLGAESAMRYRYLAERVGDNLATAAERVDARMDYVRRTHRKIHAALQGSDIMMELPDGADIDDEIEASATAVAHIRRDVNAISDLARRLASLSQLPNGDAERDMVDVNACVEEVVAATPVDAAASVVKRLGPVPEIFASKTEVRLLLAQILENSVRAVEGLRERKGTIKIDTVHRDEQVLITVIDNGPGISPERRQQIFRPFYTSRDDAMGLGLTLAGHLAKKYEGSIKINSLPGQGTVTRITLPTGTPGP